MILIRSVIFNLLYLFWTVFCVGSTALFIPFKPSIAQTPQLAWSYGIDWLLRRIAGADITIRGLENIPEGPCIVASKHESAWDTSVFQRVFHLPAYILKQELMRIPFFGWYCKRYGMIAVDRRAGSQAIRGMIRNAKKVIAQDRVIVIFPEGTRVLPDRPADYHPGVYALYSLLQLPVVPVALNSGVVWSRRSFIRRPGRICVDFLPAIEGRLSKKEFMDLLESKIENRSRELREISLAATKGQEGHFSPPGAPSE